MTSKLLSSLRTPKMIIFWVVTIIMVALDQATKIMVVRNISYMRERIDVIPGFFSLVHTQNPGAAIGLLGDYPVAIRLSIFGVFTVVAIGVIFSMLWQLPDRDRFQSATLALIMSGALGNAIDRIHKQTVTDFLLVYTDRPGLKSWLLEHFGTYEYPTFNVADAAIVVGVGFFMLHYLFLDDSEDAQEDAEELAGE